MHFPFDAKDKFKKLSKWRKMPEGEENKHPQSIPKLSSRDMEKERSVCCCTYKPKAEKKVIPIHYLWSKNELRLPKKVRGLQRLEGGVN